MVLPSEEMKRLAAKAGGRDVTLSRYAGLTPEPDSHDDGKPNVCVLVARDCHSESVFIVSLLQDCSPS